MRCYQDEKMFVVMLMDTVHYRIED